MGYPPLKVGDKWVARRAIKICETIPRGAIGTIIGPTANRIQFRDEDIIGGGGMLVIYDAGSHEDLVELGFSPYHPITKIQLLMFPYHENRRPVLD